MLTLCMAACLTAAVFLGATYRFPFLGAAAAFCACLAFEFFAFASPLVCPWTMSVLLLVLLRAKLMGIRSSRSSCEVVDARGMAERTLREAVVLVQRKYRDRRRLTELPDRP